MEISEFKFNFMNFLYWKLVVFNQLSQVSMLIIIIKLIWLRYSLGFKHFILIMANL